MLSVYTHMEFEADTLKPGLPVQQQVNQISRQKAFRISGLPFRTVAHAPRSTSFRVCLPGNVDMHHVLSNYESAAACDNSACPYLFQYPVLPPLCWKSACLNMLDHVHPKLIFINQSTLQLLSRSLIILRPTLLLYRIVRLTSSRIRYLSNQREGKDSRGRYSHLQPCP
jgi:hypothetical protein